MLLLYFFPLVYIFILFTGENPLKEHTHARKTESKTKKIIVAFALLLSFLSSRHLHSSQLEFIEAHDCHPYQPTQQNEKENPEKHEEKEDK